MEKRGDGSEADQNVLQSESEELSKTVPGSATKPSDGGSGGDCSSKEGVMSEDACEENRKKSLHGKDVQNIQHDGESVQSEAGREDNKLDESETCSEKLDAGKENESGSDNDGDISEGMREVTGSHPAIQEGESDVNKNNKDTSTGNTVGVGNESNMNTSDSEAFGNEESSQNMSSFDLEGSENDISLYLSSSDADINESEQNQTMNSSDMRNDENEDSQTLSSSGTEGSKSENIQTISISTSDSSGKEDVSQSTVSSGLEGSENGESSQTMSSSFLGIGENEEKSQTMSSSSDMEGNESEKNKPNRLDSEMEDENNKMEVTNENSSEMKYNTTSLDQEKDDMEGNEEDIQKNNKAGAERESDMEIKKNINSHDFQEEPEHLTEKIQGGDESRPKDTQDYTKSRSLEDKEEKTLKPDHSIQDTEGSGVQEQGLKIMTEEKEKEIELKRKEKGLGILTEEKEKEIKPKRKEKGLKILTEEKEKEIEPKRKEQVLEILTEEKEKETEPEIEPKRKEQSLKILTEEKENETEPEIEPKRKEKKTVQSEVIAEQEEMETEGSKVEDEEQGGSREITIQKKVKDNETPIDVKKGKICEDEPREKEEEIDTGVQVINSAEGENKTQKSVDEETRQSNQVNAAIEKNDINKGTDQINVDDHDNVNEELQKLIHEVKSKPLQKEAGRGMSEVTPCEDANQSERLNETQDLLTQTDKHRVPDKEVSEKASTSQRSIPEEASLNQDETLGSDIQEIRENESREKVAVDEETTTQENTSISQAIKESEQLGQSIPIPSECSDATNDTSSEMAEGAGDKSNDDSRKMKHKDTPSTTTACKKKLSDSCDGKAISGEKKVPPGRQNIAKKSTAKRRPERAANFRQQPSTSNTQAREQDKTRPQPSTSKPQGKEQDKRRPQPSTSNTQGKEQDKRRPQPSTSNTQGKEQDKRRPQPSTSNTQGKEQDKRRPQPSTSNTQGKEQDKRRPQPSTSNTQGKEQDKRRPQPSTSNTEAREEDAEDSDDSDIVVLSASIKTPMNVTISGKIPLVCRACQCLWNDDVLDAIFDGNKSVTVNSKITYGAIMCFSSYADIHYAQNKETAVRNVLERADLGKNIGNIQIKEILEWLRYLMKTGSVTCCKIFDAVYNPKSADVVMSRLLSEKEAAKQNSKTSKKQSSYSHQRKHKAAASSGTTASAKNINQPRQIEARQVKDTTAKKVLPDNSCTDDRKRKAILKADNLALYKKHIASHSGTPSTPLKDDPQSLNKKFVLKECSVYLGKPVQTPSTPQRVCSSVSSSTTKSTATKRTLTEEMDEVAQSTKKGRASRRSLSHEELTDSKISESSVKDAIELPVNNNSTADVATDSASTVSSKDLNEDNTLSECNETNMNTSENEESLTEQSSDLVPTRTTRASKQLADKKSITKSEQITAKPNKDIGEKGPAKGKEDKTKSQDKSKTIASHVNKNIKCSRKTEKIDEANIKDAEDQIIPQKSKTSIDDSVSNMPKPQEHSKNVDRHDIESTKSTNKKEKIEETIVKDADVERYDRREQREKTNKIDSETEKCDNNENVVPDEEEIERHDNNKEIEEMNIEDAKAERHKKHQESEEDIEDAETEKHERSEDVNMKDTADVDEKHKESEGDIEDAETEKHERSEDVNMKDTADVDEKHKESEEDAETEKHERSEDVNMKDTADVDEKHKESEGDIEDAETEKHERSEDVNMKDAADVNEKHKESEEDIEDAETEKHERSEDVNMKDTDVARHDKNTKAKEADMSDATKTVTKVVSTDESVQNTIVQEDISEKVKKHGKRNIKLSNENTKSETANMKDTNEETVTEKHEASTEASTRNSFSNPVKRSAESSTTQSTKKQKVSDESMEETSRDTETEDLTQVMGGVSSRLRLRTRSRNGTKHLSSTDSNNSESSMPASFEDMESSPSGQQTPNCESSDENSNEARPVSSQEKTEENILKSAKALRSRSRRTASKNIVSYSETSDSNDQLIFTGDSVPKTRTGTDYRPVPPTESTEESENILVQKLGLNNSAIELYCNTTDIRMPTNRDVANNPPHDKGRPNAALEAMLKERSNLDGVAKEAFDLLPFEQNNVIRIGNNRERYLTNQELLVLQNICVLNPEAPDVDMFYQILIQVLLARRRVLLVPNSLALLVVAEKVRREFNRAKRKGNHGVYLAQDWDASKIYTTEDFWLADKKPPRVPTVRTVLSMFCLWKNLEKRVPISLPIALEELCRNLVLGDVDKIGICVKLYSRYCTFLYEEKNPSLAEIFLNQTFIGSKTQLQKKKLLYSKVDTSENVSSRHTMNVTENDVQALLKQCLEAEQAALLCPHPKEEEKFRKCVQALKYKVDAYKKEIQLIQKVTKDTEKKKFQLLSKFNSPEFEDLPQEMVKTTENLYRLLAKRTTKFEMLKEAEYMAAKETNKVPRLSPAVLKVADLGEDVSDSMKELVYEFLLNEVKVEEIRPVLCTIVENMTNQNQSVVPSNSWIRNFARITGLKLKPHDRVVH